MVHIKPRDLYLYPFKSTDLHNQAWICLKNLQTNGKNKRKTVTNTKDFQEIKEEAKFPKEECCKS